MPILALLSALSLLLAGIGGTWWGVWSEAPFDRRDPAAVAVAYARHCPVDALLVMGAAQYDGTPSDALARRLHAAAALLEVGCAPLAVVSGGSREGDRTTEGEAGVAWLRAQGVTAALLSETRARNTVENLRNSAALRADVRWLVITDDLHVARTRYAAGRLGLQAAVIGVPTGSARLRYALRETAALIAYRLGAFR
jgi:uncharacterized SAM-binding protein YcdF (DUF218 family)